MNSSGFKVIVDWLNQSLLELIGHILAKVIITFREV